ncbi:PucR family transcriptional regulator ligand-binding domain-containing protein [Deinococcus sp.]|uniref:PucR family transcriptional regulator ligand-binding domain-containing protein n=1 Tax=Deinococcus sp. TaxID=47478 RepID=UPI003C7A8447
MLPTLADLLTLPAFAGAEVLSGHARLAQPVAWVHVSEVLDAARFLTGGELLLSTGSLLAQASPQAQTAYLRSLHGGGAHGLLLELVQGFRELPPDLMDAARRHDFPLLVFRQEVSFAALTRAAHARILQGPGEILEPSLAPLLDALTETGRSFDFMQAQLGPLLGLPIRPRTVLMGTLDALLQTNFNMARAARLLGVRRQTMYYRLEQLHAMLGNLDDPGRQLGLHLARGLVSAQAEL